MNTYILKSMSVVGLLQLTIFIRGEGTYRGVLQMDSLYAASAPRYALATPYG
jgi:hypothetical protein